MNCQCHQKLIVSLQSDLRKEVRKERRNITLEWKVYGNRIFFSVSSRPRKCLAHIYSVNICKEKKEKRKRKKERRETQMLANFSMQTIYLPLSFSWWTWIPIFKRYFFSIQIPPKDKLNIRSALLTQPFWKYAPVKTSDQNLTFNWVAWTKSSICLIKLFSGISYRCWNSKTI